MLQKIKSYAVAILAVFAMGAPALVPSVVFANDITTGVCSGVGAATGGSGCSSDSSSPDLATIAKRIVNILSIIVGVVAVIMIIVGGFRYITSGGESGNVSGAKNTLIYAIVGLIIVALAQFIVHFVISGVTNTTQ
jgi:predicted permease